MDRQTVLYKYPTDIENTDKQWDVDFKSLSQHTRDLEKKLRAAGLFEHEVRLLTLRFVADKTFMEISNEMGFQDTRLTHTYYRRALDRYKRYLKSTRKQYAAE